MLKLALAALPLGLEALIVALADSERRVGIMKLIASFSPHMLTQAAEIVCAHSPDSDDAYMFYALATGKIRSPLVEFRHVLGDIQTLNQKACEGAYELTAVAYHSYPYIADHYCLMAAGSSVGDGYGPMIVAESAHAPEDLKGKRIAVPGKLTTAY